MHAHFAYALGKMKMVLVLGPTHPTTIVYPGVESEMLTVLTVSELSGCYACGNHGYIKDEKLQDALPVMKERFGNLFAFDMEGKCRQPLSAETFYNCWDKVTPDKVIEKLKKFFVVIAIDLGGQKLLLQQ